MEPFYPLHAFVCEACFLVQLEEFESPQAIFSDYAYFSSYSQSWNQHAQAYANQMIERFVFGPDHLIVEVASNDGYLLRHFREKGIPVLGVEPARNVAAVADGMGIPTVVEFFGVKVAEMLASAGKKADLLVGNNVLAHVPDLNDFVAGLKILLKPDGVLTMEFPHLMRLVQGNQFDTIYHEHFSYFSLLAAERVFAHHGLELFDVEELSTHGGSLRIFAKHISDESKLVTKRLSDLKQREIAAGMDRLDYYQSFSLQVERAKRSLLTFLMEARAAGKTVVGYGAPAKGNTLLNFCGIRRDLLEYTVDLSPHKQGRFLPGTRIPIFSPDKIAETKPDYLLILPWNIKDEIMHQMAHVRTWGGKFAIPIPAIEVFA